MKLLLDGLEVESTDGFIGINLDCEVTTKQKTWTPNQRRKLANRIIRLWLEFAEHGTKEKK